jgi:hypothetical protein
VKTWKLMLLAPLLAWLLAAAGKRFDTYETSRRTFLSPGRFAEYDAGPVRLVYYRTARHGTHVEIWPYWRPPVVLYRGGK